jgi:glycosyltransferase involved in cell wall biosynthesis
MNILMLTSTFPANRDDSMQHPFQMDFIDMLRKNNHTVTVLTHAKNDIHEKMREDLDIVWFPWRRVQGRLAEIDFIKAANITALLSLIYNGVKHVKKTIDQDRIDLVICLWAIPSGLYMYINSLLKMTEVPYVLWALGSDINKYRHNFLVRSLLKKIIRRSAYVFADGFGLCRTISQMSGKHCEFLPTFRKIRLPEAGASDPVNRPVSFLYVGRHSKVKGIDLLIRAIIGLEKENPRLEYCVTIIGEGELTSEMTRMVIENKLQPKVKFEGKVPDDPLFDLYSRSDCVIIPSRSESIPVVLSEALQFNKPMIVTDVGDMGMLGRKYGIAQVVEKENIKALADEMRKFIEKPFQPDPQMRNEVLSLLMMENSVQKMLNVISEVGPK